MSNLFKRFGRKSDNNQESNKNESGDSTAATMRAIQGINAQIRTLEKQQDHTRKRIDQLTLDAAAASRKKDKKTALHKLKMRKMLHSRIDRVIGQIQNLETQKMVLDEALTNASVLKAMSGASKALKEHANDEAIEKAEEVHETLQEQMDNLEELGRIMNEPLQFGTVADDEELEKELELLDQEDQIDDPNSEFYLYKNVSKTKQINKNIKEIENEMDEEEEAPKLTKEEEKEFEMLEKENNLLLNKENVLNEDEDEEELMEMSSENDSINENENENEKDVVIAQSEPKTKKIEKKRIEVMTVTRARTLKCGVSNDLCMYVAAVCH